MGMPDVAKVWTREEVLALPDDSAVPALVIDLPACFRAIAGE